jgi:hypothetical protein
MASSATTFLLAVIVASFTAAIATSTTSAYAQDNSSGVGMRQPTSGGSLDIMLEPEWSEDNQSAKFKVSFFNPDTDQLHEHQDYDFRILKDGQEVFSAARQTNQDLVHNIPGTITVPYTFEEQGSYTVEVYLGGVGIPATPTDETAQFNIQVTPEFPAGIAGVAAALMTTAAVVMARKFRR